MTEAPRKYKNIPGLELVEMKELICCGGAGSTGCLTGISENISSQNEELPETGPRSGYFCPACTMQLAFGIKLFKLSDPLNIR